MNDSEQDKPSEAGDSGTIETDKDARLWGMLAHLLGIFTYFVGPLVIWLIKKGRARLCRRPGRRGETACDQCL